MPRKSGIGVFLGWTLKRDAESSCTYDHIFSKIKRLETTDEKGGYYG